MKTFNETMLHSTMNANTKDTIVQSARLAITSGVKTENPIGVMNTLFPVWSTEILEFEIAERYVTCTVALYLPGMVKTGKAISFLTQSASKNEKLISNIETEALYKAMSQLSIIYDAPTEDVKKAEEPQAQTASQPKPQQTAPQQTQAPQTAPQQTAQPQTQSQPQAAQSGQQRAPSIRQDQVDYVTGLKNSHGIANKEQLLHTFKMWNPNIASLEEVYYKTTPAEFDGFINWMNSGGPINNL